MSLNFLFKKFAKFTRILRCFTVYLWICTSLPVWLSRSRCC